MSNPKIYFLIIPSLLFCLPPIFIMKNMTNNFCLIKTAATKSPGPHNSHETDAWRNSYSAEAPVRSICAEWPRRRGASSPVNETSPTLEAGQPPPQ